MSLYDDYQTLLRRGMPPPSGLSWDSRRPHLPYWCKESHGVMRGWTLHGTPCDDGTASDLVAMAAMRFVSSHAKARCLEESVRVWSTHYGQGLHLPHPDDYIQAVLVATQYLEPPPPKSPLDTFIERHAC